MMKKNNFLVVVLCVAVFYLGIPAHLLAKASYVVAPGIIEFDLNTKKRQTKSFLVRNTGDERIRLAIRPIFFKVDSKHLRIGQALNPETEEATSLIPHLRLSPPIVSLVPQQRRTIRISVKPTAKLAPGDYRAHVLIKIISREPLRQKKAESTSPAAGVNLNLDLQIETAISLVARLGKPETNLSWSCRQADEGKVQLILTNPGKWRFKGWAAIHSPDQPLNDTPLELLNIVAYRETKRDYTVNIPNMKGIQILWGEDKARLDAGNVFCDILPK